MGYYSLVDVIRGAVGVCRARPRRWGAASPTGSTRRAGPVNVVPRSLLPSPPV